MRTPQKNFAKRLLESVAIYTFCPLLNIKRGYVLILVISERFTKLTQAVPLHRITAHDVAVAIADHWVFKYVPPDILLSYNGLQFVAHLFQHVLQVLQVKNSFTTAYRPQCNGQVERFKRSLIAILRFYDEYHSLDRGAYTLNPSSPHKTCIFSDLQSQPLYTSSLAALRRIHPLPYSAPPTATDSGSFE